MEDGQKIKKIESSVKVCHSFYSVEWKLLKVLSWYKFCWNACKSIYNNIQYSDYEYHWVWISDWCHSPD